MVKVTLDAVVAAYVATKDEIDELTRQVELLDELQDKRLLWCKSFLDKTGQVSAKTALGTVSKRDKLSTRVQDWKATLDWIVENEKWEFLNAAVNKTKVIEMFKKESKVPPGVGLDTFVVAGFTKNRTPTNRGEM